MIRVPMTIESTETSVGMSIEGGSREVSLDVYHVTSPSPATGAFLVYDGSAWTAQTLSTWQGGNY